MIDLNVAYSTVVDVVTVPGRVSSAGAKVAPAGTAYWTSAKTSTGVYTITFTQTAAQFLGAQVTIEGSTGEVIQAFSGTVLTVSTFNSSGSANDRAFSFVAYFSENKAA